MGTRKPEKKITIVDENALIPVASSVQKTVPETVMVIAAPIIIAIAIETMNGTIIVRLNGMDIPKKSLPKTKVGSARMMA